MMPLSRQPRTPSHMPATTPTALSPSAPATRSVPSVPPVPSVPWRLARRTERMNPSAIREILKLTELPGIVSLAGGLPSPDGFPVEAMRAAAERVLRDTPREALQYAARVAVEAPTYLGALQAFDAYEPEVLTVACDDDGPLPEALATAVGARFLYLLPNFQNPSGRCIGSGRRAALADAARALGLPLVEDNPYGELWYDAAPAAPLASLWPEGTVYLGSFSKVLAPGLRLGYMIAPPVLFPKLLQAKQAADLHTPGFNQRVVHEVIRNGFLSEHVPMLRARYRLQRDAMQAALAEHLGGVCRWNVPSGGMFFWLELPDGLDAAALLPRAVEHGVAFVPGAAFFASDAKPNTLRLSFVTVAPEVIAHGVAALAAAIDEMRSALPHDLRATGRASESRVGRGCP